MQAGRFRFDTDAGRRAVYVGLTRAKRNLYIHCNNGCFDSVNARGIKKSICEEEYPEPQNLVVQLTYTDVYLSFFKKQANIIRRLRSGCILSVDGNSLYAGAPGGAKEVLRFSGSFQNRMQQLRQMGYQPTHAKIRFVVVWSDKNDGYEWEIILPDIYFRKSP
jgi:ATP-dependent DNA helicase RecQ